MEQDFLTIYFFTEEIIMPSSAAPITLDTHETENITENSSFTNPRGKSPDPSPNRLGRQIVTWPSKNGHFICQTPR